MTIFRIEHPESKSGPYKRKGKFSRRKKLIDSHSYSELEYRPTPGKDELPWDGVRYGTKTLKSLRKWFKGWMQQFKDEGFVIAKYKVRDAQRGKLKHWGQIAFKPEDVLKRTIRPWTKLDIA